MTTGAESSAEQLILAAARGETEAFGQLYDLFAPAVWQVVKRVVRDPRLSEDVTQEVFVAVIVAAARYVPGRSGVVPWLLGIARNHVRRSARWDRRIVSLSDPSGAPRLTIEIDPLADIANQRGLTALRDALRQLPRRYREMVVLCDLEELSYADAAAIAGCAIGTVRSRLHRGRTMLAARLRLGTAREEPPLMKAIGTVL